MLVEGCVWPGLFDARNLPRTLRAVTGLLAKLGVSYALAGRLALGRYCAPQMTDLIEVRLGGEVAEADLGALNSIVSAAIGESSTVRLASGRSQVPVEDRFIASATAERWFDADVRVATSEHLLWLAMSAETVDADADAERLLHSGSIDWRVFNSIADDGNIELSARLALARMRAAKTARLSYCASVERRLAMRSRRHGEACVAGC